MGGGTFRPLPEETFTSRNGRKVEFAVQYFIARDVQLRPRIEQHEEKKHHSKTVYYRGQSVGSVGYTTTDTRILTHNDTRLLIEDSISGEENILDLRGVEDGYFRGDQLALSVWRASGDKQFTQGHLQNLTRGTSYTWYLSRRDLSGMSARGLLPQFPAIIDLAIFFFLIWPFFAQSIQRLAQLFSSNSNIPWASWVLGLFVAWFVMKKLLTRLDGWWHAPIDEAGQRIIGTVQRIARTPPATPREAGSSDVGGHQYDPHPALTKLLGYDPAKRR